MIFSSRSEILQFYDRCDQLKEPSIEIITDLKSKSEWRDGMYLTLEELDSILHFKLRDQYGRQKKLREKNEEQLIRRITELAFSIDTIDQKYTDRVKIKLLTAINGVGIPVASACLALVFPEKYAIIDRRNWKELYGKQKKNFTISDYLKYIDSIREISNRFNISVQKIDIAIWQKNYEKGK